MSNRSHLIAKRVADKRGFVKTVYVRPEPDNCFRMPRSVMSSHSEPEVAGVHWEDARNPRIAALVKKQKRGNDRLDASFEVVISNKSGTVILGAPEELDTEDIYMRGGCVAFAYAASMLSGHPLAIFNARDYEDGGYWQGHIALEVAPGDYLDISGVVGAAGVQGYFTGSLSDPITVGTPEDAQRYINRDFTDDDISGYIAPNVNELGWLVTVDFAYNALTEFGVPVDMARLEEIEKIVPKA